MDRFKGVCGKWRIDKSLGQDFRIIKRTKGKVHDIAQVVMFMNSFSVKENKANAKLISKAPEMLEMLMYFTDFPDKDFEDDKSEEFFTMTVKSSAIAKAKKLIKEATDV